MSIKHKKILIFHPAIAPYRVDFFNSIESKFNAIFYFINYNVLDQKFNQESLIEELTFNPNYLNSGFNILGRSFRFGIMELIRRNNPDIVLCSEYGQITILSLLYKKFFKRKLQVYIISDDSIDILKSCKGLRLLLRTVLSKYINGIIFPSAEVCNWYNKNISATTKTLELPIIHNDNVFRVKLELSLTKARENLIKYNLLGYKVVLYVGRLTYVKNIHSLITAFNKLNEPYIKLVIIGSGEQEIILRKIAKNMKQKDNIIFTGRKEDKELYSWYSIANVFILPSTFEPFGAVVNEALIAGCNVICSKLAGASSLITINNGFLFDPYNTVELTNKIKTFLSKSTVLKPNSVSQLKTNKMPFLYSEKIDLLLSEL